MTLTRPCRRPTPRRLALQCREDFVRVTFDFDIGKDGLDGAVLADDEGGARDAHVFAAHELLLLPDAVLLGNRVVVVGQEWEHQVELLLKLLVGFDGVRTDAQDLGAVFVEEVSQIAEGAGFLGAAGRVVPRVEVEHHGLLALEARQGDVCVVG